MVAITVLSLAVVGPFQAIRSAFSNSIIARDQLISTALAQEGIEHIRSVRDNNYLSGASDWLSGLGSCMPGPCVVDTTQNTVSSTIAPLRLTTAGLYTQQNVPGSQATRFTRTVTITSLSATQARITVTVSWTTAGGTFSVNVTDNIHDWL